MNLANVITAICSLLLLTIGVDKFSAFIEPPCSLMNSISSIIWKGLGILQLVGGILIWLPKYRKPVAIFFIVFMLAFMIIHPLMGTFDIGGAASIAVLLGLLVWNPGFLGARAKER